VWFLPDIRTYLLSTTELSSSYLELDLDFSLELELDLASYLLLSS